MKGVNVFFKCLMLLIFLGCQIDNANEMYPLGDEESTTKELANVIDELGDTSLLTRYIEEGEIVVPKDIRVIGEVNDSTNVLLAPVQGVMLKSYLLVLYNVDGILSVQKLNGSWIDNDENEYDTKFLHGERIVMVNYPENSMVDLLIMDRKHIGNIYNAAVMHAFNFDFDSINYLGEFEYISHLPLENKFLVRYWDESDGKVSVYLKQSLLAHDSLLIGNFDMDFSNEGVQRSNVFVMNPDYKEMIFSTK